MTLLTLMPLMTLLGWHKELAPVEGDVGLRSQVFGLLQFYPLHLCYRLATKGHELLELNGQIE